MYGTSIRNTHEYLAVAQVAQDRVAWREVVNAVTSKQLELRDARIQQDKANRRRRKRRQQSDCRDGSNLWMHACKHRKLRVPASNSCFSV